MLEKHRKYSPEFKSEAVRLVIETPRRGRLGQKIARVAATCAMGSWVVIGVVPVVVAICALR